jgi:hypothetical protein
MLGSPISPSISARGVQCPAPHQRLHDFQRLLSELGLGEEEVVDIHSQSLGVGNVEGMFRVNEGAGAAGPLGLSNDMQAECGLSRRLRPENLRDASSGYAADPERRIKRNRSRGDDVHGQNRPLTQPHHRSLAVLLFDLLECDL